MTEAHVVVVGAPDQIRTSIFHKALVFRAQSDLSPLPQNTIAVFLFENEYCSISPEVKAHLTQSVPPNVVLESFASVPVMYSRLKKFLATIPQKRRVNKIELVRRAAKKERDCKIQKQEDEDEKASRGYRRRTMCSSRAEEHSIAADRSESRNRSRS